MIGKKVQMERVEFKGGEILTKGDKDQPNVLPRMVVRIRAKDVQQEKYLEF